MKKVLLFSVFVSMLSIPLVGGCGKRNTIDNETKSAFLNCKQKVDIVKNSISELTMDESGKYTDDGSSKRNLKSGPKNYVELTKDQYLTLQNFGIYVLNNVYHSITYGYDSESVALSQMIYDEVQNEIGELRTYLKSNNLTSKFYMQIEQEENAYSFKVDWLGLPNTRGNIYVGGKIELNGHEVSKFTVTSFTEDESCYLFAAHYDFVANNFYMFNISHYTGSETKLLEKTYGLIDKFNNKQLTSNDLEEFDYSNISLASGKITENINEINYKGCARELSNNNTSDDEFNNLYNSLKDKYSDARIRTSREKLDYSKSKRVHFMDKALQYGLDTTKLYVSKSGSAVFSFIRVEDFIKICDTAPQDFKEIFKRAKTKLQSQVGQDKSLEFEDDDIRISYSVINEQYSTLNTYTINDFSYLIADKKEDSVVQFYIKGDYLFGVHLSNTDYVPDDDPNYEEEIKVLSGFGSAMLTQLESSVVTPFNAKYKGKYKVVLESAGSTDRLIYKIANQAESGKVSGLPELMMANSFSLETLVANDACRKYLYNFDSFMNDEKLSFSEEEYSRFDQLLLDDGNNYSVEGRWALPFGAYDNYLVYDVEYFSGQTKQYDVPTTFDELISVAQSIKNSKGEDFVPIQISDDSDFIVNLMLQNNIPFISEDHTIEYIKPENKDKIISLLTTLKQCLDSRLISSRRLNNQFALSAIQHKNCAMAIVSGGEFLNTILSLDGFGVAAVPFANGNQIYSRTSSNAFTLLKTGKPFATRGAWLFVKEMLNSFNVDYCLNTYSTPLLNYDINEVGVSGLQKDVALVSRQIADKYHPIPKVENLNQIYDETLEWVLMLLYNHTPEEVYNNLISH